MKAIFFCLCAFLFIATGCTKENSEEENKDTNYYMRFTANGEVREYKDIVLATRSQMGADYVLSIQGQKEYSATTPGLSIVITQTQPFTAKTYTELTTDPLVAILYRNDAAVDYSSLYMTAASGLEVVISQINSETVRGTFAGSVADVNGGVVPITEGEFYVKFQ